MKDIKNCDAAVSHSSSIRNYSDPESRGGAMLFPGEDTSFRLFFIMRQYQVKLNNVEIEILNMAVKMNNVDVRKMTNQLCKTILKVRGQFADIYIYITVT